MKVNTLMVCAAILTTGTVPVLAQDNLVVNGSFEEVDDIDGSVLGWSDEAYIDTNRGTFSIVSEGAKDGNNCLLISAKNGGRAYFASEETAAKPEWVSSDDEIKTPATVSYWYKPIDKGVKALGAMRLSYIKRGERVYTDRVFYVMNDLNKEKIGEWNFATTTSDDISDVYYSYIWDAKDPKISFFINTMKGDIQFDDCRIYVGSTDNISSTEVVKLPIKTEGTTLYVAANDGEQIRVFTVDGSQVTAVAAEHGTTKITNLPKGLLLVKAGKQTGKVLIK